MTRLDDKWHDAAYAKSYYYGPFVEPSTVLPAGSLPGLHFDATDVGKLLFANKKMALGAVHTAFWAVTPSRINTWGFFGYLRPGRVAGSVGWGVGSGEGDPDGVVYTIDFASLKDSNNAYVLHFTKFRTTVCVYKTDTFLLQLKA